MTQESHPLLEQLGKRVLAWRAEARLKTCQNLDLACLGETLHDASRLGIEPELLIFVVAISEWWFRVYQDPRVAIERALRDRLHNAVYSPLGRTPFETPGVPAPINRYVDQQLSALWNDDAPEQSRFVLKSRIPELVREYARPLLVAELHPLPPRPGGYPQWSPWVSAASVYGAARLRYPAKNDARAINLASTVAKALLKREVLDESQLHHKRQAIKVWAPQLLDALLQLYQNTKTSVVQGPSVQPLLDDDCFQSLRQFGGLDLVMARSVTA